MEEERFKKNVWKENFLIEELKVFLYWEKKQCYMINVFQRKKQMPIIILFKMACNTTQFSSGECWRHWDGLILRRQKARYKN